MCPVWESGETNDFTLKKRPDVATMLGFSDVPIGVFSGQIPMALNRLTSDMDRERIERQIKLAEQKLAACEKQLDGDNVPAEKRRLQPKWRTLDADLRALKRRMSALKQLEEREEAALQRKNQPAEVGADDE